MKLKKDPRWLPWTVLVLGAGACVMRFMLYRVAVDERGLLIPRHPLELGLWALAAVVLVLALVFTGREPRYPRDEQLESLGQIMAAVGIAVTVAGDLSRRGSGLDLAHLVLGLITAVALCYGAILRWQGKGEPILCAGVSCIFFALHLVCRYRGWSAHPQVQDYFFPLMGAICAMAFGYLRCDEARMKLRRVVGLAGTFCCLAAVGGTGDPGLYLGAGLWMITNLHAPGEKL